LLEAGHHEITASAPGYLTARSTLNVDGGDRTTLVFALNADDYAALSPAQAGAGAAKTSSRAGYLTSDSSTRDATHAPIASTLGYVSLGLGVASLVGFGVSGGLALAEKSKLDDHCPNTSCTTAYQKDVERYDTLRTLSTVTLIAGGALTLLGVTLLVTRPTSSTERATSLEAQLGPGAISVRGQL
jgi:hypothetical protein